jgi:ADP-L-glycero-D-manno-heptose 6-epimerase
MYLVTGGAGFIGSNIIAYLNSLGIKDILLIDDLTRSEKIDNIKDLEFLEYLDWEDTFNDIDGYEINHIFHCGGISSTIETDGRKLMKKNYDYSIRLFTWAYNNEVPVKYTSSASIYGRTVSPSAEDDELFALNPYAYSKLMVEKFLADHYHSVISYRLFNVFGKREEHKIARNQASPVTRFIHQAEETGIVKLFRGSENIFRDFICVDDVVQVMVHYNRDPGSYNLGTGKTTSFADVAHTVAETFNAQVEYVDFPDYLRDKYQYYTCANMTKLGPSGKFIGVLDYIRGLGVNG